MEEQGEEDDEEERQNEEQAEEKVEERQKDEQEQEEQEWKEGEENCLCTCCVAIQVVPYVCSQAHDYCSSSSFKLCLPACARLV